MQIATAGTVPYGAGTLTFSIITVDGGYGYEIVTDDGIAIEGSYTPRTIAEATEDAKTERQEWLSPYQF